MLLNKLMSCVLCIIPKARFIDILQANDITKFSFDSPSGSSDGMPVYLAGLQELIGWLIVMFKVTGVCPQAIHYHLYLIIFHN